MARKIFIINSVLLSFGMLWAFYNSMMHQGEHYSASRSYFLVFVFITSFIGLYLVVKKEKEKSAIQIIGFIVYALLAFLLLLEGALIV